MKKLVTLLTIAIISISCNKVNSVKGDLENQEFTPETIKKVFDEVSKIKVLDLKDPDNNAIYINYTWDSRNGKMTIKSINEEKMDIFPLFSKKELEVIAEKYDYNVHCSVTDENGNTTEWDKTCTNQWNCGGAIKECLDQGGCATICENMMVYYPHVKTFILRL